MIEIIEPNTESSQFCWAVHDIGKIHTGLAESREEAEQEASRVLDSLYSAENYLLRGA